MSRLSCVLPDISFVSHEQAAFEAPPAIREGLKPPTILGNGALIQFASNGGDVNKVFGFFSGQARQFPNDASFKIDQALLHLIRQEKEEAYRLQAQALEQQQLFRVVGTKGEEVPTRCRVLALIAPGDFMNNAQLEFLVDGSEIGLDVLYIVPEKPLPSAVPEHDVLFCAVNESDENLRILQRLSHLLPAWPRPVLNVPGKISRLSRDGTASLFKNSSRICTPAVRRVGRAELRRVAQGEVSLDALLPKNAFPVLARPVGSHCGKNLERITSRKDLSEFLKTHAAVEEDFFLSSFIDYRDSNNLYRKYRVALIDGTPLLCHMAISDDWKIHYVNAGMAESALKRAEEAHAMETFDYDFGRRHGAALAELYECIGLDYFGIDCAELPDGRLLLFEAETAMVIHAMDSPTLYPYKKGQMAKVFAAFHDFIERAAGHRTGIAKT